MEFLAYALIVVAVAALFVAGDRLLSDEGRDALGRFMLGRREAQDDYDDTVPDDRPARDPLLVHNIGRDLYRLTV